MPTERDQVNIEHAANPLPGDYWHEMFAPICVVLAVAGGMVVYCDKTRSTDNDHWTWDLSQPSAKTREEFRRWLHYGSETMAHLTVGQCEPEAHKWAADLAKEM